ncbi:Hypothetical protein NTJ_03461 [Nesidiocoris tenuis]|uniref:Uncharacterized protein n=1 Tax=Nesidiocoris tenuis TaxID=355587 RepID=A0ABN7AF86_9HEMI|nr:Hypothetical protein NTJ_03461 [Nesidiocoris tenuis]
MDTENLHHPPQPYVTRPKGSPIRPISLHWLVPQPLPWQTIFSHITIISNSEEKGGSLFRNLGRGKFAVLGAHAAKGENKERNRENSRNTAAERVGENEGGTDSITTIWRLKKSSR